MPCVFLIDCFLLPNRGEILKSTKILLYPESKALLSKVPKLHFQPDKKIKKRKFVFGSRKHGSPRRKTLRNDSDSTWTAIDKNKDVQQMDGGQKEDNDDSPAIDATGQEKCRKPKFSLREFVRLIDIIGMDADAGDAYGETGQSIPREQLDAKITSDYFWTTTIADRFNSEQVRPRSSHDYLYSGLDPGPPPLAVREGSNLKTLWTEFRKDFTEWNRRYNQSGQNSPDFKSFIQESKSRGAPDVDSARGVKLVIGFHIMGMKGKSGNTLLSMLSRGIDPVRNEIGQEEGLGAAKGNGVATGSPSSGRRPA